MDERVKRDNQIQQTDSLIRQAIDQLEDALYVADLRIGELTYLNTRVEPITGFSVQELQDTGVQGARDRIHPEDRERYLAGLRRLIEQGGSETLEYRWLHKDGTYRWLRNRRQVLRDDQGQPIALVGTLRDVTEQRLVEETLWEAEAFNTAILDTTGALIVVLDPQGRIVRFNRACEDITGYPAEEVIGRVIWEFLIPPEEVEGVRETFAYLRERGLPNRHENDWLTRDEGRRRIAWSNTTLKDEQGNLRYVISSGMDITEQRVAEEELRESEERFRALYEQAAVGIKLVGMDGRIRAANQKLADILGYTRQELIGCEMDDLIAPEDLPAERKARAQLMAGEVSSYTMDKRYLWRGTQPIWVRVTTSLARGMREPYRICVVEDINEQKQAEQALRKSEELFHNLLENSRDGIHRLNLLTGQYDFMSPSMERLSGYTLQELTAMSQEEIMESMHPEDREPFLRYLQEAMDHPGAIRPPIEYRIRNKSGEYRWYSDNRTAVTDAEGRVVALVATSRDITEQKRAEQALRESEERFRSVLENSRDTIYRFNLLTSRYDFLSPAVQTLTGFTPQEIMELSLEEGMERVHPEDRELYLRHLQDWQENPDVMRPPIEYRVCVKSGEYRWFSDSRKPVMDANGRVVALVGTSRDITEQRQAERALRESEERFREVFTHTRDAIYRRNLASGKYEYFNPAFERLTGFTTQELTTLDTRAFIERLHPEDRERLAENLGAVRNGKLDQDIIEQGRIEYRWRVKSGEYRWFSDQWVLITNLDGTQSIVGSMIDITEQKQAEQALRESEERFREVFTHTRDALYRLDVTNDRYDYANPALEELIGLTSQEMAVQGARVYIERLHPEDRDRLAEYLEALRDHKLDEGIIERANQVEYRWRLRDGEYHWFSDQRTLVTKPDGTQAIVGSMLDITPVKQSEQRLRELNDTLEQRVAERTVQLRTLAAELSRAEERERQRLARILHDHLQQLLVAARLNISTMQRRLTEEPLQRAAERVDDVLDEAIRTSRSLTAELSPPVLYDAGLTPALHWLARWIEEKHGLVVEVDAEDLGNQPPEGLRAMLFQATRELLFNVVKHAGVDRAWLTLRRVPEDRVELTVRDEGVGFDPARIGRQPESGFGLFSIRERLELLGGRMKVVSAPGRGTQVTLQVPLRGAEIEAAEEAAEQAAKRMVETGRGRAEPQVGETGAAGRPPVQVLLVDDHTIMRQGLARLLQDEGIELAGQADNGREAIALALMTHPDVILMDVSMPGMDGVEATRRILDELPDVKVIGLSMHEGSEMAARMRQAGAVDYMPKGGDPAALIDAVRRWAQKES